MAEAYVHPSCGFGQGIYDDDADSANVLEISLCANVCVLNSRRNVTLFTLGTNISNQGIMLG